MKNPETRKAPCQSCKSIRRFLVAGQTYWCGGCGTWHLDPARGLVRPLTRMS